MCLSVWVGWLIVFVCLFALFDLFGWVVGSACWFGLCFLCLLAGRLLLVACCLCGSPAGVGHAGLQRSASHHGA